ncbi:MAG: EamA family transporter [Croceibacterium sp.]
MTGAAPPHALLRPRIVVPFVLIALIWGSTWLVIKDQIGTVPPSWSVTWRFALAAMGMAALALVRRERLVLDRSGHLIAIVIGLTQFCMNFNLVYRAEQFVTSGIVAVLFALLMLPNALLGRLVLGAPVTRRFMVGTSIALAGIALMLLHEARIADLGGDVWWGVSLTGIAILSASCANVMQATTAARRQPMITLLAYAMAWGTLFDFTLAWITSGPPVLPLDARFLGGVAYLAIIGSVVTFPMYFQLIREIGPGRAAYNGVVVPVVAMILSTLFEGYRWSWLAAAGGALAMVGLVVALRARKPMR